MIVFHKVAFVKKPWQQLMAIVEDVERYPEFLVFCERVTIQEKTESMVKAEVTVGWNQFSKKFSTRNTKPLPNQIHMSLLSGALRHLEGDWLFEEKEGGCQVSLDLNFEFKNVILKKLFHHVVSMVAEKFFKAFCERAEMISS